MRIYFDEKKQKIVFDGEDASDSVIKTNRIDIDESLDKKLEELNLSFRFDNINIDTNVRSLKGLKDRGWWM